MGAHRQLVSENRPGDATVSAVGSVPEGGPEEPTGELLTFLGRVASGAVSACRPGLSSGDTLLGFGELFMTGPPDGETGCQDD